MRAAASMVFLLAACLSLGRLWAETRPIADAARQQQQWWLGAAPDASVFLNEGRFEDAVVVQPRLSAAWIGLGLEREGLGEFRAAEAALLEAARVDHQYLPAWTLANFYFRRGSESDFWRWAALAAPLVPDDVRPLLALTRSYSVEPKEVLRRLGASHRLTRAYTDFLIGTGRLDLAQEVALELGGFHDPADDARVADLVSRHIAAGDQVSALYLWNTRFAKLDPVTGPLLADAAFSHAPTGSGFEPRTPLCDGATVSWREGQLHFELDGTQPDGCILYEQPVPAQRLRAFRLRITYATSATGLVWTLGPAPGRTLPPRDEIGQLDLDFAPAQDALPQLRLAYYRPRGSARASGWIVLRKLELQSL